MGTITITVDAGAAGTTTKSYTVTNTNIGRLADWSKARLPQDGPNPTNGEAIEAWMDWAMQFTRQQVLDHEQRALAPPTFDVT